MNCDLQRGSQPTQPFEPPFKRITIVPLAAECVMPAKPAMNIWGTALQDRSVVLLIHSQKVLQRNSFDNRVIHARLRPNLERAILLLVERFRLACLNSRCLTNQMPAPPIRPSTIPIK